MLASYADEGDATLPAVTEGESYNLYLPSHPFFRLSGAGVTVTEWEVAELLSLRLARPTASGLDSAMPWHQHAFNIDH